MSAAARLPSLNYFAHETVAKRYARHRPYFHPRLMDRIRRHLALTEPVESALDVGCGTGQSTVALMALAREVVGADISAEMLAAAWQAPPLRYVQTPAETLPFPNESFDLVTVGIAFHWFDRSRFLPEAHRVLKPGGPLLLYSNGFGGASDENADLNKWLKEVYLRRYPAPPRHGEPITTDDAAKHGFYYRDSERFADPFLLSCEELAAYLTTQSNVIAAAEQGTERIERIVSFLVTEMTPYFGGERLPFTLVGALTYLEKER